MEGNEAHGTRVDYPPVVIAATSVLLLLFILTSYKLKVFLRESPAPPHSHHTHTRMHTPCICCLLVKCNLVLKYLFYTIAATRGCPWLPPSLFDI